jgi:dipeptidyl aminopeptidase/acylaminoacyl peptidase
MDAVPTPTPYGAWPSPISVDDVVGRVIGLSEPWVDGDDLYWIESRPVEGGRRTLIRRGSDGETVEVTHAPANVRSRVHEYGGGSYTVAGGTVVFSEFSDGRVYRVDPGADHAVPITPDGPWRYADMRFDAARRRFLAVREDHGAGAEPVNEIVTIPLDGDMEPEVIVSGPDFVASPRPSPDGSRLVWLEWDHPDMPWDTTRLRAASFLEDGSLGMPTLVAGGHEESITQPAWSPDGTLHFVSDRSGYWNVYRLLEGPRLEALGGGAHECADPSWVFGQSSYAFLADGSLVIAARRAGRDRLIHVDPGRLVGEVASPYTEFDGVSVGTAGVVVVAGAPDRPTAIVRLDPVTLGVAEVVRLSCDTAPDAAYVSHPESIEFATSGGRTAHALFYAPVNRDAAGPAGDRPPLVVLSHGGPTSHASTRFDPSIQFLTSRGIAVVDVDYGGSTGYGREYRRRLEGGWGKVDVDDCVAAALYLAMRGDVARSKLAIMGGSAGGFTTLAALATRDVFAAGISAYGVADLEALARDTHKFESRYLDRLVGPLPASASLYRERSPLHHLHRIRCPVLVLQGLQDRIVPPTQAEAIVAALEENGVPYAYLPFEDEGHGFRGEVAMRRSLEAQLSFLGQVFGFEPADEIEPVEIVRPVGIDRKAQTASTAIEA